MLREKHKHVWLEKPTFNVTQERATLLNVGLRFIILMLFTSEPLLGEVQSGGYHLHTDVNCLGRKTSE